MKFDELLGEIGEFGPYQKRIFIMASLVTIPAGYQIMSFIFLLEIPDYRCAIPGNDNDTFAVQSEYHQRLINQTIPQEINDQGEMALSKCKLYNFNSTMGGYSNGNSTTYACSSWVYDRSVFGDTVITEFNVICGNEIYRSVSTMVGFGGGLVGSMMFGVLADIIGRKKSLLIAMLLNCIVSIGSAFVTSFVAFTAIGFFFGWSASGIFMIALVIGMEIVGPKKREITGGAVGIFWAVGLFLLNIIAYFVRTWRNLRLALGVPPLVLLVLFWMLPESPRWLVSRGRMKEAKVIIRRIAESNKVEVEETKLDSLTAGDDEVKQLHFWHMLKTPWLCLRAIVVYFTLFTVSLGYFGLSINVGNLAGDIYLNFFISNITEAVTYPGSVFLMYKIGRRPLLVGSMMLGGLACITSIFPNLYGDQSTMWTVTAIAMVGKLGASAAFIFADMFAVELFPTVVRQSSVAMGSLSASVGGMAAPYIADLGLLVGGELAQVLPLIVFGTCSVVVGLFGLILPETKDKDLPESIEDAITFGVGLPKQSYTLEVRKPKEKTKDAKR